MKKLLCYFLFGLLLATPFSYGQAKDTIKNIDPPILNKGINASSWLANAPRQPMYHRDFLLIKRAGFDHIRLPINPEQFGFKLEANKSSGASEGNFFPVDKAITLAITDGLNVILDMHPSSSFRKTLEENEWAEQQFIDLWTSLVRRYKDYPVNKLVFGLLNEPQYYKSQDRYNALVRKLVAAIREIDPHRVIVVGAARGSSIRGLEQTEVLNDSRIIYDFHFYEPYIITHQGIHQGFEKEMVPYFRKLPYPADKAVYNAPYYAPNAPSLSQAQAELEQYVETNWNAERIAERIKVARDWADKNNAKIMCGEFGVLRNHIDPPSRYRWITDVRKAFEANGIPWQLWDYTDIFGITEMKGVTTTDPVDGAVVFTDPDNSTRTIEAAAITALGLKQP